MEHLFCFLRIVVQIIFPKFPTKVRKLIRKDKLEAVSLAANTFKANTKIGKIENN